MLNYILKSWYRTHIIISSEQISISHPEPFRKSKIQIDNFTKPEIFINQIISEKRAKPEIESGIINTDCPVEYEYIKGKKTALELIIRDLDSDGKSQEKTRYKIAPKLLSNEHRQLRELNSILTAIKFAIKCPGKKFNKLKFLEQIPIKIYTVYTKKGPQKELFKVQILDATLISKGRAFETGTLVTICLNTLLFEENSARKKSPQSISLQYCVIDSKDTYLFLSLPENSYGYTDVSKDQKFYFNEDLNFLKEHSAIYWNLQKSRFMY